MTSLNKVKMRINKTFVLVFLAFGMVALPFLAQSRMTFYSFGMSVPDEVNANPGATVDVEGEILVTGMYWLHNFDLTVSGLSYDYEIEPAWWEHVRILRDWNPQQGVFRVPEKFKLTINVPEDASGAHLVTITGQEHHSFREVSNETYFVLTIDDAPAQVNLSISDILVPEMIKEYEPFNLTFKIDNAEAIDIAATVSVSVPEDWEVDEASKTIQVKGDSSEIDMFTIIPTTTSGEISLFVEYPFKGEVINFTKVGPYLVPSAELPTTTTTTEAQPFYVPIANFIYSLTSPIIGSFESLAGAYAVPAMIGIIIILLIIIFWIVSGMFKFVRSKSRAEPESMETKTTETKSKETKNTTPEITSEGSPEVKAPESVQADVKDATVETTDVETKV